MPNLPDLAEKDSVRCYLIAQRCIDRANQSFPWYDSIWLRTYTAAKAFIRHVRPERMARFVESFDPLRTRRDFSVQELKGVFSQERLADIRRATSAIPPDSLKTSEGELFGRSIVHDFPPFVDLQKEIEPLMSEVAGELVEATYNFLSLYSNSGACSPHMDTPLSKWTFDVCINQSRTWPLHLSQIVDWPEEFVANGPDWTNQILNDPSLTFQAYNLEPGDAVVFSGSSQWHFREPLREATEGDFCNLLFFHFLPKGMSEIAHPENWPRLFEIDELRWVVAADELRGNARG